MKNLLTKGIEYKLFSGVPIEQGALDQMAIAMRLPITVAGALMPDAHQGYGLPIGGVLATNNAIIPYAVGMDIGCRMALSLYKAPANYIDKNQKVLMEILNKNTRFGTLFFKEIIKDEVLERIQSCEYDFIRKIYPIAARQLSTSGSGNHFVEFGNVEIISEDNKLGLPIGKYLGVMSHSGSRNFGYQIAQHYTKIAQQICELPKEAQNLAWFNLDSPEGKEYWAAMNLAGDFSKASHKHIHSKISKALDKEPLAKIENHHNFAWKEEYQGKEVIIHRKGATPAFKDVLGLIPGSMATPAYLVKGRGNELSLNSASHGAGRKMSRSKAKRTFTKKDLEQILKKAKVTITGGGIDEIPLAYKNIKKVIAAQKDLVDVIGTFEPRVVKMEKGR